MLRWLNRLIKLAILLVVIALIFDLHYKGRSSRDYAWEYGKKASAYLYDRFKALVGKDLDEIRPKSLSEIPAKVKEIAGVGGTDAEPKATDNKPGEKGSGLTEEDREALRKLLEQKSQKK